ncbi:MAG: NUDIX hydrolase [Anaerolineaceae bacterium]|nr:NUDIX hydrolase [Anaerolineaceae bacterium]
MSEQLIRFCLHCGAAVEKREFAGKERPVCPRCNWVYFPDPKVAAGILVIQEDRVLLVRRIMAPQRGHWGIPAGFVDAFEDPARAAERECLEETGLLARVDELFTVLSGREHPRGADIFIAYRGTITGGIMKAGDDADLVKFFPFNQLPRLAFNVTHKILDLWLAERSR